VVRKIRRAAKRVEERKWNLRRWLYKSVRSVRLKEEEVAARRPTGSMRM
jgi:hypothetical protein